MEPQIRLFALMVLAAIVQTDLGGAVPTQNMKFYFFFQKSTWNSANQWCKSQGLTMLKVESEEVLKSLHEVFRKQEPRYTEYWHWLGLHDTDERPNEETYMWSDCTALGSYRPWDYTDNEDKMRCAGGWITGDTERNWGVNNCSEASAFVICQRIEGQCGFQLKNNTSAEPSTKKIYVDTSDESECIQNCREHDSPECWGFEMTNGSCLLYFEDSYTNFTSKLTYADGINIMVKFCFEGITVNADIPQMYHNDSAPHSGCGSTTLMETTTTTTPDETATTAVSAETSTTLRAETTSIGQKEESTTPTSPQTTPDDIHAEQITAGETRPLDLSTSSIDGVGRKTATTTERPEAGRCPSSVQKYSGVVRLSDEHGKKLRAEAQFSVESRSATACGVECFRRSPCALVNYNTLALTCKGYPSQDVLNEGREHEDGWEIWVKV